MVPEPNTWREVPAALDSIMEIRDKHVAVQEYGIPNRELVAALESRGAQVTAIPVYRWALPEDLRPLHAAIQAILNHEADSALFTNAPRWSICFVSRQKRKSTRLCGTRSRKWLSARSARCARQYWTIRPEGRSRTHSSQNGLAHR
jgi:hypothetical protein